MKTSKAKSVVQGLQKTVQLLFKDSIHELRTTLSNLPDESEVSLETLKTPSKAMPYLNYYGVLVSAQNDYNVRKNPDLQTELQSVVQNLRAEFPDLGTSGSKILPHAGKSRDVSKPGVGRG